MATIGFRPQVKALFFDRLKVINAIRKDELRYYARAGALGMKIMRQRIRPHPKWKTVEHKGLSREEYVEKIIKRQRDRASKPGHSPRGRRFKKSIFFAAILPGPGVVIGPVGYRGSKVPALLEEGGPLEFRVQAGPHVVHRGRTQLEPRPFRAPTLRVLVPQLPKLRAQASSSRR